MLKTGQTAETTRSYTDEDLAAFAAVSDNIPSENVPEPLIAALFSYLLGVKFPGPGTNYLKHDLRFYAPAPRNIQLTAQVEITRLRPEKQIVDLWARCITADGTLVCEGRSLVKAVVNCEDLRPLSGRKLIVNNGPAP